MIGFGRQGIRWRLASFYSSIFALGLSVFCGVLFKYFERTQLQAFDTTLYNFAVDLSSNLEMDFVGRLFVINPNVTDAYKLFPFHLGKSLMEIRDMRGQVLRHSRALENRNLPLDPGTLHAIEKERAIFQTIDAARLGLPISGSSRELRLLTFWAQHADWSEPLILQVAVPLDLPAQERRDLLLFFLIGIPSFLVVSGLAGVWMSKRALRPVHDITLKAQSITGVENLKERIPVPEARDEIFELATTFNSLLDRLDKAFASQDRFISNASHQLKTPLTILKGELEILRKSRAPEADLTQGLESAASEINRLIQLVQDLLLLARLEAGRDTIALSPVRVDEVLLKVVARLQKMAERKKVRLITQLSADALDGELGGEVRGDEDLLESMLENLIENAVKYSPSESSVEIALRAAAEYVEVRVRDYGPGVPAELRTKIFERFTRAEPSSVIPGSGLGLAIASEIARLHDARIELDNAATGRGTVVRIRLPLASPTPPDQAQVDLKSRA